MSQRLVYVCEGGDCTEKGSVEICEKLKELLERDDPGQEHARVRKYPCFGACEHGINVTVWPDRIFYSRVTENDLREIEQHLVGKGPPVARLQGLAKQDVQEMVWTLLDSPY